MKPLHFMTSEELWDFWVKYHNASREDMSSLVGNFPGYTKIVKDLANYACNRNIYLTSNDKRYLDIAERIYNELPLSIKVLIK